MNARTSENGWLNEWRDELTWIDGASDNTSERIPGPVIKPVVEGVEALLRQVLGGSIVEVRIELMNHRLEPSVKEKLD